MKQAIAIPSDVYVEGYGVGYVYAFRQGHAGDRQPYTHYCVWFDRFDTERLPVARVYRAIATFAGWFFVGRDGRLHPIPGEIRTKTVAGQIQSLQPNMQNIPIGRRT